MKHAKKENVERWWSSWNEETKIKKTFFVLITQSKTKNVTFSGHRKMHIHMQSEWKILRENVFAGYFLLLFLFSSRVHMHVWFEWTPSCSEQKQTFWINYSLKIYGIHAIRNPIKRNNEHFCYFMLFATRICMRCVYMRDVCSVSFCI